MFLKTFKNLRIKENLKIWEHLKNWEDFWKIWRIYVDISLFAHSLTVNCPNIMYPIKLLGGLCAIFKVQEIKF